MSIYVIFNFRILTYLNFYIFTEELMGTESDRLEFRLGSFGAFLPLITLLGSILVLVLTGWVHTKTLWIACLASMFVAIVLAKKPAEASDALINGMARRMVAIMALAWMLASIMGRLLRTTGLVDSLVWLGVNVGISGAFLPLATFIIAALFSTATGTSGGSIAAIGPLMLPVGVGLGANPLVMIGALMSGAFFGDNIAPISDTTIASAYTQGAEIKTVVKSRLKYALVAAAFSVVMFIIFGLSTATDAAASANLAPDVSPLGLIMLIVPAVLIFIMYKGVHLVTALIITNACGIVLGLVAGLMKPSDVLFADVAAKKFGGVLYNGINGMLPIIIFTMLLLGLVGVFDKAGLFDRILNKVSPLTKSVRNAELTVLIMTIFGNIITAGSARSIVAFGPLAKEIGDRHNLSAKRNANIMDAIATGTIMFVPYNPGVMLAYGIALTTGIIGSSVNIIQAMPFFFHGMGLVVVMLIAIFTGWGRVYKDAEAKKEEASIIGE
jgi:Na+/H+ antiporter NhaC